MLFTRPIIKGNSEELILNGMRLSSFTRYAEVITTGTEGRDGYQATLDINDDIDGRDGGALMDYHLPPREIAVNYLLRAKNYDLYRKAYTEMALELAKYRTPTSIMFADEPGWEYFGVLKEFSAPEPGRLSVVGTLSFVCPDPYKYWTQTWLQPAKVVTIPSIAYPVMAEEIIVRPGEAESVTVQNKTTGRKIRILVATQDGDVVTISGGKIYKNRESVARYVDFSVSNIYGFMLHTGDEIETESGTVEIRYRERRL